MQAAKNGTTAATCTLPLSLNANPTATPEAVKPTLAMVVCAVILARISALRALNSASATSTDLRAFIGSSTVQPPCELFGISSLRRIASCHQSRCLPGGRCRRPPSHTDEKGTAVTNKYHE